MGITVRALRAKRNVIADIFGPQSFRRSGWQAEPDLKMIIIV
ncbi:hypothetical protein RSal33209_2696 [Renibacterium salmoninarum ATCC 33209]|uniref:Uncharacterized protein n=1 Tax=Renibacterium salmoninarum (strain ATCC 33209 / DSM 20767 / JCM 11484 / NBRC 15589 / NCIMB 2235) TaxID=288705 RepID=A9WRY8_RENSM|nr:hypothetical protein RSal33209_2696 [Renibacterium salmoninarum ATCC 33209]